MSIKKTIVLRAIAIALLVVPSFIARSAHAENASTAWDWSGLYAGATFGGGGDVHSTHVEGDPALTVSTPMWGALGGPQIGYNWQNGGSIVWGIETDISATTIGSSNTAGTVELLNFGSFVLSEPSSVTVKQNMDMLGTARLRLGVTPADHLLAYVTGGLAYGHVNYSSAQEGIFAGRDSALQAGWVIGAGSELALCRDWSIKGEFLHYDLGDHTLASSPAPFVVTSKFENAGNLIRVGFNYRFD